MAYGIGVLAVRFGTVLGVPMLYVLFGVLMATKVVRTVETYALFRSRRKAWVVTSGASDASPAHRPESPIILRCGMSQGLMYATYGMRMVSPAAGQVMLTWSRTRGAVFGKGATGTVTLPLPVGTRVGVYRTICGFQEFVFPCGNDDIAVWVSSRDGRRMIDALGPRSLARRRIRRSTQRLSADDARDLGISSDTTAGATLALSCRAQSSPTSVAASAISFRQRERLPRFRAAVRHS